MFSDVMRVLIVEDDEGLRRQIEKVLGRAFDIEATSAATCAEARRLLSSGHFDIVTVDYMLPDGRGLDLLEEMAALEEPPRTIMVTGHGDEETAAHSLRSSASGYVVKDAHLFARLTEAVEKARSEIRLSRARLELELSEARFRSLIENASDMIMVVDPEGTIVFASPSVERVLGYSGAQLEGASAFDYIHPDDLVSARDMLRAASANEGSTSMGEYRFRSSEGEWLFLESLCRDLVSEPSVGALVINSRNVTRRKVVEAELADYREHLEHLVGERTEELRLRAERLAGFLTVAAHELRHPLSVIKGYTTLLSAILSRVDNPELPEILEALNVAVNRLTDHVEEFMQASLVEEGRFVFEFADADAAAIARDALAEMEMLAPDREFHLQSPDRAAADLDAKRFRQMLITLLDNAIKFSPEGSRVSVLINRDGESLVVRVMDRGAGVPPEERERIFERFYQVEDIMHHSKVGLGLGLYFARVIAEAHGGSIACLPRDGGGSVFVAVLPTSPPGAQA